MKRLIAVLLTICIAAGLPVAAFAENGPSSGEWSKRLDSTDSRRRSAASIQQQRAGCRSSGSGL